MPPKKKQRTSADRPGSGFPAATPSSSPSAQSPLSAGSPSPPRPLRSRQLVSIAVAVVLGVGLGFVIKEVNRKGASSMAAAARGAENFDPEVDAADITRGLGRTVVIGERLHGRFAQGTEFIPESGISGLAAALDGKDVRAVVQLLRKTDVAHLVVDPWIARKDPLPTASVRNRLAFSLPAAELQAIHLRKDLIVYRIGNGAPALSQDDKRALIGIVRKELGAKSGSGEIVPPALEQTGEWQVFVTLRPLQQSHLSFYFAEANTLSGAARLAARRIRSHYAARGWDKKFGPIDKALNEKIGLEFEVLFDHGEFKGPRDNLFMWRVVEPGITGLAVEFDDRIHRIPPWLSVTTNLRTVESVLERLVHRIGGRNRDEWKRAELPIARFRTVHWRERKPGGDIEDLFRAAPRVPAPAAINKESLIASLEGLTRWLSFNSAHYSDGRMIYRYFPTTDAENGEYNMVRHTLGAYSMALGQEFIPDPSFKKTADACVQWMIARTRYGGKPRNSDGTIDETATAWNGKPLPGPDVALFDADENMYDLSAKPSWSNKMGAAAVGVLGLTQYRRVGWQLTAEQEKLLTGLANFLLYMQKDDGSFHHYYVSTSNGYYGQTNSIYPGEIMYAVARLYGETKEERYRTAFRRSMDASLKWFTEEMARKEPDGTYVEERRKELVQFQPWIAMSMEEMYRHDPDPAYVKASNLVSLWIIDTYQYDQDRAFFPDTLGGYMKVLDELPAMHTFVYTEGTAASYVLARTAEEPDEIIARLREGALLAARFILQMQIRQGENDYTFPNPQRAKGGVNYCMNHSKQRIDYTYHALSSVYRILHAATEEDYAFIQSVPLPTAW